MENKKRPMIAIIAGNAESEYFDQLIAGFRNCAEEEDVNLVFMMGPHIPIHCKTILAGSFAWDYEYQFHTIYEYVHFIQPDAIIVAYGSLANFTEYVPNIDEFVAGFKGIPTLTFGDSVKDPEVPSFFGANYSGMKECVSHLVEDHGYRKIGFVAASERNHSSNHRLRAYRDVLTEHGIEINEDMIVHGNFTEFIDDKVEYLLDHYPDIEAIVFANDSMAKSGYRVCAERGLRVGKDIAITGFDDDDVAKVLDPALTSVAQSSYMLSYRAMQAAVAMCKGKKPNLDVVQSIFKKRESCGCKYSLNEKKKIVSFEDLRVHVEKRIEEILKELFSTLPYEKEKSLYKIWLSEFFNDIIESVYIKGHGCSSKEELYDNLMKMCQHPLVSKRLLLEYIQKIVFELMDYEHDENQHMQLYEVLRNIRQYVHSQEVKGLKEKNEDINKKMWFIPSFTADLISEKMGTREQMNYILGRLKAMGIRSAYLLFDQDKVVHKKGEKFQPPKALHLTAYYNDEETVCYTTKELVKVDYRGTGVMDLLPQDSPGFYYTFVIFAGEEIYGLLIVEAEQKDYFFAMTSSMQLGTLRRVININIHERQMQKELEEKNHILSMLSMNDELTKLLNRRGFMEKALQAIRNNKGKKACMVFADVDHLKEINDSFGHPAGDFAIISAADYLRENLPEDAVIARIGGDEYVALFIGNECCGEQLVSRIKSYAESFNQNSDKQFYVEMSVGVHEFICESGIDLGELFKKSDAVLYEQKRNRRFSVKKK